MEARVIHRLSSRKIGLMSQAMNWAICSSLYANAFEKGMNPSLLPSQYSRATCNSRFTKPRVVVYKAVWHYLQPCSTNSYHLFA